MSRAVAVFCISCRKDKLPLASSQCRGTLRYQMTRLKLESVCVRIVSPSCTHQKAISSRSFHQSALSFLIMSNICSPGMNTCLELVWLCSIAIVIVRLNCHFISFHSFSMTRSSCKPISVWGGQDIFFALTNQSEVTNPSCHCNFQPTQKLK